ncbi:MAG: helix-hairpin-helix domain-containing protein, partial [Candidatus Thermoplasmatota archaeon]|nr:helix-hairpin-helix domain-containing protein [Candidatus Thermoplasmatota archaeon]
GVPYHIPLETSSNIMITGHGARSITGVEVGLDINTATEKQLEAVPGIGKKAAWNIVSARAKLKRKEERPSIDSIFASAKLQLDSTILSVFADE